jgi:hypothetical protein
VKANPILNGLDSIGKGWTRQIKAEERSAGARQYRTSIWAQARVSLKDICYDHMDEAWSKASGGGGLPTHWRQVFYVMRPICDQDSESDRPLRDTTFKNIFESYLEDYAPGWDVLYGARGVFKEPHAAVNDTALAMSTANVRNYLHAGTPGTRIPRTGAQVPDPRRGEPDQRRADLREGRVRHAARTRGHSGPLRPGLDVHEGHLGASGQGSRERTRRAVLHAA